MHYGCLTVSRDSTFIIHFSTGRLRQVLSGHLAAVQDSVRTQDCGQELSDQTQSQV